MIDMKRSEADMASEADAIPADVGQYPYGLCINMDKDELDKLGITELPAIGAEVHLVAVGTVTRISQSTGMDESMSMSVQITMMDAKVEPAHEGEESETPKDEMKEFKTLLSSY